MQHMLSHSPLQPKVVGGGGRSLEVCTQIIQCAILFHRRIWFLWTRLLSGKQDRKLHCLQDVYKMVEKKKFCWRDKLFFIFLNRIRIFSKQASLLQKSHFLSENLNHLKMQDFCRIKSCVRYYYFVWSIC